MANDPEKENLMQKPLSKEDKKFLEKKVEEFSEKLGNAHKEIATEIWGQDKVIGLTLASMVANGHLLNVGVPGLAKTRLVSRVATVMGLDFKRVQCTPDLMPHDILGSEVQNRDPKLAHEFNFVKGPVFTQFLMVDEINRAAPRTQAAFLEAMQERKVTMGGTTYSLKRPFLVMATQNPIDQQSTYPLPEAQLDRFLMRLDINYPDEENEKKMVIETTGKTAEEVKDLFSRHEKGEDLRIVSDHHNDSRLKAILEPNDLILMQDVASLLPLSDDVIDAIMQMVRRARPSDSKAPDYIKQSVEWGPGPRASQAFAQVARAHALMRGEIAPNVGDILAVIEPVLEHRMVLNYLARAEGVKFQHLTQKLKKDI